MVKYASLSASLRKELKESRLDFSLRTPEFRVKEFAFGSGYPITGLEKFLGYYDSDRKVANFPSISATTDFSQALCGAWISHKDRVILDGVEDSSYSARAGKALDIFRKTYGIEERLTFNIERRKRYRNAKGLGESAAVACAVSSALCNLFFAMPTSQFISRWARYVSGSGTRSAAGGISLWMSYPGIPESRNHAIRVRDDLGGMKIACFPTENPLKTEDAHGTAASSPFYDKWARLKFELMIRHIRGNFDPMFMIRRSQEDMLQMHALLTSMGTVVLDRRFTKIMELGRKYRDELFVTADTGPTPVIFYRDNDILHEVEEITGSEALKGNVMNSPPVIPSDFVERTRIIMES